MEHLHCYKFEIQKKISQCLVEIFKKIMSFFRRISCIFPNLSSLYYSYILRYM